MIWPAPCAARMNLLEMACEKLGVPVEGTTDDGLFTVEDRHVPGRV